MLITTRTDDNFRPAGPGLVALVCNGQRHRVCRFVGDLWRCGLGRGSLLSGRRSRATAVITHNDGCIFVGSMSTPVARYGLMRRYRKREGGKHKDQFLH
jgi:hypothetical protein